MPLLGRYKICLEDKCFRYSTPLAIVFFIAALFINFMAIDFATDRASSPVADIILSNTRALEVDGLFVYGTAIYLVFALWLIALRPNRLPFALHALTLFIVIRALFTSMTHIGPFEETYLSDFGNTINRAFFGADHFFSGHTGMPFLGALAFWHIPWIRNIFLSGSVFFAVVVLLGHIHYTIDVAAAFFITYGIYHLSVWLFPLEHRLFLKDSLKDK